MTADMDPYILFLRSGSRAKTKGQKAHRRLTDAYHGRGIYTITWLGDRRGTYSAEYTSLTQLKSALKHKAFKGDWWGRVTHEWLEDGRLKSEVVGFVRLSERTGGYVFNRVEN